MSELLQIRSFIGTHDKAWEDLGLNQHSSIELTLVLEGSGFFRSGNKQHLIESGHVVLIPPNIPHSFHAVSSIRFGVLLMDGLPPESLDMFNSLLENPLPRIITLSRLDQEHYETMFYQWLRVLSSSLKEPTKSYLAWIQILLLFFHEHSQSDQHVLSTTHVADYIRQHLHQDIHISDLAILAGLSVEGLRKRFFKVYGMNPKHYQHICRLAEAKWLLSSTEKDMQSIADIIGFKQLHSFSTWFKKLEGISPANWRKLQRMNH